MWEEVKIGCKADKGVKKFLTPCAFTAVQLKSRTKQLNNRASQTKGMGDEKEKKTISEIIRERVKEKQEEAGK